MLFNIAVSIITTLLTCTIYDSIAFYINKRNHEKAMLKSLKEKVKNEPCFIDERVSNNTMVNY